MTSTTEWWEIAGGLGGALGGVAAAVGAIAAWRAASASRATSRDALEALAVGIRPRLTVTFSNLSRGDASGQPLPAHLVAWIVNEGEWPATDLEFELWFRDGRRVRDGTERLDPAKGVQPIHGGVHHEVILTPAPPGTPSLEQQGDRAVLRFSDERRIARYERRFTFIFEQTQRGSITRTRSNTEVEETRI